MALSDIKKLADYAMQNEKDLNDTTIKYVSCRSSMIYARGNILLVKRRFI